MELAPTAIIRPAPDLVIRQGATVLIGGYPTRVLSLSPSGGEAVSAWFRGRHIGELTAHRRLAWRLVAAGIADLERCSDPISPVSVTVVMPVKDDMDGVVRSLRALAGQVSQPADLVEPAVALPVIVVDDNSTPPVDQAELEADLGPSHACRLDLTVVRLATNQGPAAARNRGLDLVETPLVAFVDADVSLSRQQLGHLAAEVGEPNTVAVAPRVKPPATGPRTDGPRPATATERSIRRYEKRWSALDMGPRPAVVGPGRPVPYVPTTCLVAAVSAINDSGCFDESLRYGEDVDLTWRLVRRGWVRYVPSIEVQHPSRPSLSAFARQRFNYGTAASALAERHPRSMAPVKMAPAQAVALIGLLCRSPVITVAAVVTTWRRLGRRMSVAPDPRAETASLILRGMRHSATGLATATARVWWPLLCVLAVVWPPLRRRLLLLVAAGLCRRLHRGAVPSTTGDVVIGAIDDGSYAVGVWAGVIGSRNPAAIIPDLRPPASRTAS